MISDSRIFQIKLEMNVTSNYQRSLLITLQKYSRKLSSLTSKSCLCSKDWVEKLKNVNKLDPKIIYIHHRLLHSPLKMLPALNYKRTVLCQQFKHIHPRTAQNRLFSISTILRHGDDDLKDVPETVRVTFINKDGTKKEVMGKVGEIAMYLAHRKGVDMEGACEASLACTTCHCYVESSEEHWDLLPEATEKEEDLLDMAPFLDVNSRLGCQIILTPELDGIILKLPAAPGPASLHLVRSNIRLLVNPTQSLPKIITNSAPTSSSNVPAKFQLVNALADTIKFLSLKSRILS